MLKDSFENKSSQLLNSLKEKYDLKVLNKIKYKNLLVLVNFISNYKPKSRIKKEEADILEYLILINSKNLEVVDKNKISNLEKDYIYPCINRFMKYGFRYRFAWIYILLLIFVFDLILFSLTRIYVPILSIIYTANELRKEIIAHKANKLW